jgi:type I restriction enzyme S subunit
VSAASSVILGKVADLLVGNAFKSDGFLAEDEDGIPILRGENIGQGSLKWVGKTKRWREDDLPELGRYELQLNDIILAMDRPIVGDGLKYAWITEADLPCLLVQRVCRIRGSAGKALTGYLRYVIGSPAFTEYIHSITTGANIPHISGKDIAAFSFPLPSLAEQEKIVEALAPYDDLVKTYEKQIALLEEAARLIYTEWFVRLRFPGHQSHAIKERIPVGWSRLPLGDLAEIVMGQSPESKFFNEDGDGFPFHQGVTGFGDRFVKNETFTSQATRFAQAGDILCSVRAPVGRLNITLEKIAIGRGLSAIRSKAGHQSLLLYQLKALFVEEDMIGGGAIFASVGKKELFAQELLQPDCGTATEFNRLVGDIDLQIETLTRQIAELKKARDLLLPRLISGQLRL